MTEEGSRKKFLESLIEPDVWLAARSLDGDWYVNGYKVLNSTDPLRRWIRSRKPTPSWLGKGTKEAFRVPHTAEAAARLLRHMHAALVLLDHQNPHRWPCPFGVAWVRLSDMLYDGGYCKLSVEQQWGFEIANQGSKRGRPYDAFLGDNFYQDGAKFKYSAENCMPRVNGYKAPVIVAAKEVWLKELVERLNAFPQLKKDEENKRASYL